VKARLSALALLGALVVAAQPAAAQDHTPEPYAPGEFPGWMGEVWRSEAIFVGVFPLSLFVTLEVYDSYRYFSSWTPAGGFKTSYAPWPFGSGAASTYSADETLWLAVSALSVSLVVSGIDFLLARIRDSTASP
jgi:hypothetical protein